MFSLHVSAVDALNRFAYECGYSEPVAVFCKQTEMNKADPELRDAIESGDEQQLRHAAEREWARKSQFADVILDICFCDRSSILDPSDIVSIDGVLFVLPAPLVEFLEDVELFYNDGYFLRTRDGTIVDLPYGPPDARLRRGK